MFAPPKQRRFPRATLNGTAQVTQGQFRCSGEVTTISEGGVFIASIPKLPLDVEYRVHLILPKTFEPVVCRAQVLYNLPNSDMRKGGTGMRFSVISADGQQRIAKLVKLLGAQYEKLLETLTAPVPDPDVVEMLCFDLSIPNDLPVSRLRWLVLQSVNQFRI